MKISVEDLIQVTHAKYNTDFEGREITSFAFDSRIIVFQPNLLFIDLAENFNDSTRNQLDAIQKGASYILTAFYDQKSISYPNSVLVLTVDDVLESLQKFATTYRMSKDINVVGITGSNGKTTVKEWLAILLKNDLVHKSPASYNSQLGVPLSILGIDDKDELAIIEAGISQKGEMQKLATIIQPTIGILTNIGDAHDAGFDNRKEKLHEKLLLFKNCKDVVFEKTDLVELSDFDQSLKTEFWDWSFEKGSAKIYVQVSKAKNQRSYLTLSGKLSGAFEVPFNDNASIQNCIHCIIAAQILHVSNDIIQENLLLLQAVSMRMELKQGRNQCVLIDDTYNADLTSLKAAMDLALTQREDKDIHLVLSDFLQLDPNYEDELSDLIHAYPISMVSFIDKKVDTIYNDVPSQNFSNVDELLENWQDNPPENEIIIVKGARKYTLERVIEQLRKVVHNTELQIHFDKIQHNLKAFRSLLKPPTKLMAIIKAGAYGSDSLTLGKWLANRVDYLAIAYIDEGIALREAGIETPIMVLNPDLNAYELIESYQLEPTLYSLDQFYQLAQKTTSAAIKVHVKIDTGMHRVGLLPNEITEAIEILEDQNWTLASLFTHFHSSEDPNADTLTEKQFADFLQVQEIFKNHFGDTFLAHGCNTAAISRFPEFHLDMVRLGIGMYGITGDSDFQSELEETHSWHSYIAQIKTIPKGEGIGYNQKAMTEKETKIAVVNVGYADGLPRKLSEVDFNLYVKGKPAPILGNISMDSCIIDITKIDKVEVGDLVEIIDFKQQKLVAVADKAEMIPYELLCHIGPRVRRNFIKE